MDTSSGGLPGSRLVRAWLLTAIVDFTWAVALTWAYGRTFAQLWQGVASVPFGPTMIGGGARATAIGIATHFFVALSWSTLFFLLVPRAAWLRRVLDTPFGILKVAAVYGPMIWIVMSAIVIPLFTGRPFMLTGRWFIQAAGHIVFVGLPIVWGVTGGNYTGSGKREAPREA
jgi:hypothetical protein